MIFCLNTVINRLNRITIGSTGISILHMYIIYELIIFQECICNKIRSNHLSYHVRREGTLFKIDEDFLSMTDKRHRTASHFSYISRIIVCTIYKNLFMGGIESKSKLFFFDIFVELE